MDLVTVATFGQVTEAYLAKNLLESEGIQAFLADEQVAGFHEPFCPGREARLQVAKDHAERAVEILRSVKRPD